jgi:alkaline phosphatase D
MRAMTRPGIRIRRRARRALDRRTFLKLTAAGMGSAALACGDNLRAAVDAGLIPDADTGSRPGIPFGVQSGDVGISSAVLWAASDRPARVRVRWSTTEDLANATMVMGPTVTPETMFAGKLVLRDLPAGQDIFYEIVFEDIDRPTRTSMPVIGHLRTVPSAARDIRFLWSGDTAGQGWGINLEWGGMRIYETMRQLDPDFFIHSGDTIYADNPFQAEVMLADGSLWKNVTTELTSKVAETLDEFRANFQYNLLDDKVRAFNAQVTQLVQWDDHEVLNNWYPGEILPMDEARYQVKDVNVLAERARLAFLEWTPIGIHADEPGRIYRSIPYGPLLEVFMLDMRTYRGANTPNVEPEGAPLLGDAQLAWLEQALAASKAVWKVIASDMPLGLVVGDGANFENVANGDGTALGRELELAALLRHIKTQNIANVVWLTADVHYTAAHHYDPARAQFTDFKPFWEFVSGPLNAGTFGPNALDNTFGPEIRFQKAPDAGQVNLPPSAGYQFFGEVVISAQDQTMTVKLRDLEGAILFTQVLEPEPGSASSIRSKRP